MAWTKQARDAAAAKRKSKKPYNPLQHQIKGGKDSVALARMSWGKEATSKTRGTAVKQTQMAEVAWHKKYVSSSPAKTNVMTTFKPKEARTTAALAKLQIRTFSRKTGRKLVVFYGNNDVRKGGAVAKAAKLAMAWVAKK